MARAGEWSVVLFLLLVLPGLFPGGGASPPQAGSVFSITRYDGNFTERTVVLRPGEADNSTSLTLPDDAQVVNASLQLTSLPLSEGGTDYPFEPQLDIGADGTVDWAFKGFAYGPMGYQSEFHDGSATAPGYNLSFGAGEEKVLRTRLPFNASLLQASMTLGGWPTPFWRDPIRVTPHTGSPGENSPTFYAAGDRFWVTWATKDPAISDGTDWDIVASWSFDGTSWAPPVEVTPRGDIYEDDSPDIIAYGDRIYIVWSAAQNESAFSPCNIYIRSWDGTRWENVVRLTPPGLRHLNDWPQMEVFDGRLFVFWRTTDPSLAEIADSDDMDMVYCSFDGTGWSATSEVTPDWDTEIDWSLNLVKFDGRLFVFWDMDTDPTIWGFTVDIFYRSFDGKRWTDTRNIIPQPDEELDEIPKAAVYFNPVTGQDELWVTWIRGSPGAHDLHVMVRRYDGNSWGPMTELTDPAGHTDNMGQDILEYDHRLYVVWVTGTNTSQESNGSIAIYNTYGDVVIRAYDGYRWSDLMELTPGEENDNANAPTIAIFSGKLYVGWAFPYPPPPGGEESWDIIVRNIDFRPVELELDLGDDGTGDWGPSELQSTNERIPLYTDELRRSMDRAVRQRDGWGNEYCDVGLRLRSIYPCAVEAGNLSITYSLTVRLDGLEDLLNGILRELEGGGRGRGGNVTIPLQLAAASAGRMRIHDLNLTYIINLPPVLLEDIPNLHFPEDTEAIRALDLEEFFWDDWDDGRLAFEVTFEQDPARIRASLDGRFLTFTAPTKYWHGTEGFRVRAYDRARLWAASNLFNITVDHVNHPPVLEPIPDQKVYVGEQVYLTARASDVDGDALSFSTGDPRFPMLPLGQEAGAGCLRFVAERAGILRLNVTVEDGHGGADSRVVEIAVREKVFSEGNDLCLSWLIIFGLAVAAGIGAELYRRRYLKETGPIVGPGGEYSEEEAFAGVVKPVRTGAGVQGGSEEHNPERFEPPVKKVPTREEEAAQRRKRREEQIRIPEAAVAADGAEEAQEAGLRDRIAPPGQALLPIVEGQNPARKAEDEPDPLEALLRNS